MKAEKILCLVLAAVFIFLTGCSKTEEPENPVLPEEPSVSENYENKEFYEEPEVPEEPAVSGPSGEGSVWLVEIRDRNPQDSASAPENESESPEGIIVPAETESGIYDYVLNKNSKKFHYGNCESVDAMKESNKIFFTGTRDEAISMGYKPCKNCNP